VPYLALRIRTLPYYPVGMATRENGLAEEVEGWSEANRGGAVLQRNGLLAGAIAEGLDRSATLGAEKRQAG